METRAISPRPSRWQTGLKWIGAFLVLCIILFALILTGFFFMGRQEWAQIKGDLAARGEKLTREELRPASVPDEQNFFADPMWLELADVVEVEGSGGMAKQPRIPKGQRQLDSLNRPVTDAERESLGASFPEFRNTTANLTVGRWIHDVIQENAEADAAQQRRAAEFVLVALGLTEPVFSSLSELAERPEAVFLSKDPRDLYGWIEATSYLREYGRFLTARAWANRTLGHTSAATRDIRMLWRLPHLLDGDPTLLSLLFQIAEGTLALKAIDDGLKVHSWPPADLEAFESLLAGTNYPAIAAAGFRGERGFLNQSFVSMGDSLQLFEPYLWIFGAGNQAFSNRLFQEWIDAFDSASTEGLPPGKISIKKIEEIRDHPILRYPYAIASMCVPNIPKIAGAVADLQNQVQRTRVTIVLERHRFDHGSYPSSLSELVPQFLPEVPRDIVTLHTLEFYQEGEGFRL
jgi:hypothetical protein